MIRRPDNGSRRETAGQRPQQDAPDVNRIFRPPADEGVRVRVIDRLPVGVFNVAVVVIVIEVQANEDSDADANALSQAA